ncbi:MAG: hemin-degrading factor [Sphingobacteriia bacterium]
MPTHYADPDQLAAAWQQLAAANTRLRIRDAADTLGVSEAQLLATQVGGQAVRLLATDWKEVVAALPGLGEAMALTRNEAAVIEKVGTYASPSFMGQVGQVVGPHIDLRLFMQHWAHGYACQLPIHGQMTSSLQFFDAQGNALHKVYARQPEHQAAWQALVDRFRHPQQARSLQPAAAPPPVPARPDAEVEAEALLAGWAQLQDTHDFFQLLRAHGVGRLQALRIAQGRFAFPITPEGFYQAATGAADQAVPVMFFVGNPGVIAIHTGPIRRIVPMEGWFNVMDPGFNLHLRTDLVAQAWLVLKPTQDGLVTSIELYDAQEALILQMFGTRKPGHAELAEWRRLVQQATQHTFSYPNPVN